MYRHIRSMILPCCFFSFSFCFQFLRNIFFPCVLYGLLFGFGCGSRGNRGIHSCFRSNFARFLLDTVLNFGGFVLFYVISLCFNRIRRFLRHIRFLRLHICFFGLNLCGRLVLHLWSIFVCRCFMLRLYALFCFRSIIRLLGCVLHL